MVGGAPVDSRVRLNKIGADGYGKDAVAAVQLCRKKLIGVNSYEGFPTETPFSTYDEIHQ